MRFRVAAGLCVILSVGLPLLPVASLRAQDAQADEEGRGFFIAGRAAFRSGRYEEALERFEQAFQMSRRPALLFNIGAAAERAGKPARALSAYRAFITQLPDDDARAEVEGRISALEASLVQARASGQVDVTKSELSSEPTASNTAAPPVSGTPGAHGMVAPIVVVATSAAVIVAGGVLFGVGQAARTRVEHAPDGADYADYAADRRHAPLLQNSGIAAFAVGSAGAALATWWLVVSPRAPRTEVSLSARGVSVRGRF